MNPTLERIRALQATLSKEAPTDEIVQMEEQHTLGELLLMLEPIELAFLGILTAVPFLQPIPVPGLSTFLGGALAFVATLTLIGRGYRSLPRRLLERKIGRETLQKCLKYAEKILTTLSRFPTWSWGRWGKFLSQPRALASHVIFMSVLLALPLPIPFSNSVPAWGILFASLAMLEANGVFILLSYLTLIGNVVFFGGLVTVVVKSF